VLSAAALLALAVLTWPVRGARRANCSGAPAHARSGSSAVARAVRRWRTAHRPERASWVADFAEAVAIGLRAGLDLPSAAVVSASSPSVVAAVPWLSQQLQLSAGRGQGVAAVFDLDGDHALEGDLRLEGDIRLGGDPDLGPGPGPPRGLGALERRDLAHLVAAWRLAEGVGAAAADVTEAAAASVRERQAAHERTAVVMAGPRASMLLLTALPLAGPVAAVVIGISPGRLYDSAAARLLAGAGVGLTALGWWWARRLLSRAGRPAHTGTGTP